MAWSLLVFALLLAVGTSSELWPQPRDIYTGATRCEVRSDLSITMTGHQSDLLQGMVERYRALAFLKYIHHWPYDPLTGEVHRGGIEATMARVETLEVNVLTDDEDLRLGIDESFNLTIEAPTARLQATTSFGALYGLETFAQLVRYDVKGDSFFIEDTPVVIMDGPVFPWRGLLVDTARHYLPVSFLRHVLDGMAYDRLNVLHWHIVDSESFPYQSNVFPQLSREGAYGTDFIYSLEDIRDLTTYARERGIRIVPEFDVPGHSLSWSRGMPDLFQEDLCYDLLEYRRDVWKIWYVGSLISMNPTLEKPFEVISDLINEVRTVFPDLYLHMGGDEVVTECWNASSQIREYMATHNMTLEQLWESFSHRVQDIVQSGGRKIILWEEAYNHGFLSNKDVIVDVWLSVEKMAEVVKNGYHAILSAGYYLDRQLPLGPDYAHYFFFDTWKDFYGTNPMPTGLTPEQQKRVLGGEASMWAECADESNFDTTVWPRASAAAERYWSGDRTTDILDATHRLQFHRCRLKVRGISVQGIGQGICHSLETPDNDDGSGSTSPNTVSIVLLVIGSVLLVVGGVLIALTARRMIRTRKGEQEHLALHDPVEADQIAATITNVSFVPLDA